MAVYRETTHSSLGGFIREGTLPPRPDPVGKNVSLLRPQQRGQDGPIQFPKLDLIEPVYRGRPPSHRSSSPAPLKLETKFDESQFTFHPYVTRSVIRDCQMMQRGELPRPSFYRTRASQRGSRRQRSRRQVHSTPKIPKSRLVTQMVNRAEMVMQSSKAKAKSQMPHDPSPTLVTDMVDQAERVILSRKSRATSHAQPKAPIKTSTLAEEMVDRAESMMQPSRSREHTQSPQVPSSKAGGAAQSLSMLTFPSTPKSSGTEKTRSTQGSSRRKQKTPSRIIRIPPSDFYRSAPSSPKVKVSRRKQARSSAQILSSTRLSAVATPSTPGKVTKQKPGMIKKVRKLAASIKQTFTKTSDAKPPKPKSTNTSTSIQQSSNAQWMELNSTHSTKQKEVATDIKKRQFAGATNETLNTTIPVSCFGRGKIALKKKPVKSTTPPQKPETSLDSEQRPEMSKQHQQKDVPVQLIKNDQPKPKRRRRYIWVKDNGMLKSGRSLPSPVLYHRSLLSRDAAGNLHEREPSQPPASQPKVVTSNHPKPAPTKEQLPQPATSSVTGREPVSEKQQPATAAPNQPQATVSKSAPRMPRDPTQTPTPGMPANCQQTADTTTTSKSQTTVPRMTPTPTIISSGTSEDTQEKPRFELADEIRLPVSKHLLSRRTVLELFKELSLPLSLMDEMEDNDLCESHLNGVLREKWKNSTCLHYRRSCIELLNHLSTRSMMREMIYGPQTTSSGSYPPKVNGLTSAETTPACQTVASARVPSETRNLPASEEPASITTPANKPPATDNAATPRLPARRPTSLDLTSISRPASLETPPSSSIPPQMAVTAPPGRQPYDGNGTSRVFPPPLASQTLSLSKVPPPPPPRRLYSDSTAPQPHLTAPLGQRTSSADLPNSMETTSGRRYEHYSALSSATQHGKVPIASPRPTTSSATAQRHQSTISNVASAVPHHPPTSATAPQHPSAISSASTTAPRPLTSSTASTTAPHPSTISTASATAPHPSGISTASATAPHPSTVSTAYATAPHPSMISTASATAPHPSGISTAPATAPYPLTISTASATALHPSGISTASTTVPHSSGISTASATAPHPTGISTASATAPHPTGISTASATAPHPSGISTAFATAPHPSMISTASATAPHPSGISTAPATALHHQSSPSTTPSTVLHYPPVKSTTAAPAELGPSDPSKWSSTSKQMVLPSIASWRQELQNDRIADLSTDVHSDEVMDSCYNDTSDAGNIENPSSRKRLFDDSEPASRQSDSNGDVTTSTACPPDPKRPRLTAIPGGVSISAYTLSTSLPAMPKGPSPPIASDPVSTPASLTVQSTTTTQSDPSKTADQDAAALRKAAILDVLSSCHKCLMIHRLLNSYPNKFYGTFSWEGIQNIISFPKSKEPVGELEEGQYMINPIAIMEVNQRSYMGGSRPHLLARDLTFRIFTVGELYKKKFAQLDTKRTDAVKFHIMMAFCVNDFFFKYVCESFINKSICELFTKKLRGPIADFDVHRLEHGVPTAPKPTAAITQG